MPKPLVIVESPAKARTIAGYLGAGYVVQSSVGHIRDLPSNASEVPKKFKGTDAGRLGIDVENQFEPIYVVPKKKKDVVKELKDALTDASELYLATDEDREGEAISWHVLEVLGPDVPVRRMVFHEITRNAIEEAIQNWRELDMKLVDAQESRRILDRLVGYEMSPVLWKKMMPRLSAGRVQSVATRLVVERERARMAFRAAEYWDLEGEFVPAGDDGATFPATLIELDGSKVAGGRDFDPATGQVAAGARGGEPVVHLQQGEAEALVERLRDVGYEVSSVESKAFTERPKAPFTTSTLQQEAGRKLRFSAGRTMRVAQGLYERGYITYARTDSTNLSDQAITGAREQIRSLYGDEYLPDAPRTYQSKVKNAQEAHEAIRPAGERMRGPDEVRGELGTDERRLYQLVWMRTLACQMTDARARRVSVRLSATSTAGEAAVFAASGKSYEFLGFRRAYVEGADDPAAEREDAESPMPPLAEGDAIRCDALAAAGHSTQPPARYTEASLVKELEERGIGRPSTYASVIQTITHERGYVWKKGTALVPSWTAFAKLQLMERYFPHLVDYDFTATMEEELDLIANGESEPEHWLRDFYFGNGQRGLKELVGEEHLAEIDPREVNTIEIGKDDDGRKINVRVGKFGPYLEREDERASLAEDIPPDELTVDLAAELLARAAEGPQKLGTDPETGLEVIARDGRYGPYVQLGELVDGEEKPKTASLLSSMSLDTITFEDALKLLRLPRDVGTDPEGHKITAHNGRYGPYLKKGKESRSLETEDEIFTVTLERALALFAQPKQHRRRTKPPIAELGEHPDTGAPVRVLDGRYGPYVTDGSLNATIPRGTDPKSVNLEEAVELLREREARGPAKRARKSTKKKSTGTKKKTTAKKKAGGTRARTGGDGRRAKKPPATAGEVVATMEAPPVGADDGNGRKDAPVAPDRA
ncbi:MAG TPA: type I DNA topoisomerase [Acidimicrobiia bacterium]|nr:type I DNA topoisomerase [Acidimicrobiia bacterium]